MSLVPCYCIYPVVISSHLDITYSLLCQYKYQVRACVVCMLRHIRLFAAPLTVACQVPLFIHGILQARILESVAIPFSRGSSQPRDRTHVSYVSCIGRWVVYHQRYLVSPYKYQVPRKTDYLNTFFRFSIFVALTLSNTFLF